MPDDPATPGDATEMSMAFALEHLERVVKAIPELSLEEVDRLTAHTDEIGDRVNGIEEAANWRRWCLDMADARKSGRRV